MSKSIQWFPGHMTRTLREIEKQLPNIDVVIEIVDARVPYSGRSPELARVIKNKPQAILLNKADLADPDKTAAWSAFFMNSGITVASVNSKVGEVRRVFRSLADNLCSKTTLKKNYKPRVMVVGVPNCGKSTLINTLSSSAAAKTEDRPGVTRGIQWVVIDGYDLLDVPGVLTKRFDDRESALKLAYSGAIRDEILDTQDIVLNLIEFLKVEYPNALISRYGIAADELAVESDELLRIIAKKRGMLVRGGEPDEERAAVMLLDELRAGKLGRISFEAPHE